MLFRITILNFNVTKKSVYLLWYRRTSGKFVLLSIEESYLNYFNE